MSAASKRSKEGAAPLEGSRRNGRGDGRDGSVGSTGGAGRTVHDPHGGPAGPAGRDGPDSRDSRDATATATATAPLVGLAPVIAPATRLIVLGSFPGIASLRAQQYYGHPRNHFWPILAALWDVDLVALPYAERLDVLRARGLGIWDVYASCRREGSLDSAIEAAQLNDLASLGRRAPQLRAIAHNGGESARAMAHTRALGVEVLKLPSTSPANASWSFERKLAAWRAAFERYGIA